MLRQAVVCLIITAGSLMADASGPKAGPVPEIQFDGGLTALTLLSGVLMVIGYRRSKLARVKQ